MLRTLSTGKIFTTLDLRGAYNLLRIKEGDEPKTAFITKYGQVRISVVYSDNLEDHKEHVRQVLQILKDNNLFCKAEKCHFYQTEIKYLGYIFRQMDFHGSIKISAVQDWPAPKKVRELQVFLGFTNFYRALVLAIRILLVHLTKLAKKGCSIFLGTRARSFV
ncbi:hypothetical protein BASA81_015693 [Batrachochytrium salamandrivorans]|nr:hypothetical protein BASA81_015693 [Batrachochytrium salamandrivorans]